MSCAACFSCPFLLPSHLTSPFGKGRALRLGRGLVVAASAERPPPRCARPLPLSRAGVVCIYSSSFNRDDAYLSTSRSTPAWVAMTEFIRSVFFESITMAVHRWNTLLRSTLSLD
ncbi:hypothetical protein CA13_01140 [Planctomycetes bacterium CA13]|uniref:Uncharacterized protein n=1 Tax=Novipirellula herctigrandis TaxID=2527986 RepID=A0A5C5YW15_9BACT|nr:hypothetical protein CA13_01140 [Planctomycetes bacterium CA13]